MAILPLVTNSPFYLPVSRLFLQHPCPAAWYRLLPTL